jgi:hypothetical protein
VSIKYASFPEFFHDTYLMDVSVVTDSEFPPTGNISYIPHSVLPNELLPAPVEPIITTFESILLIIIEIR